MMTCGHNSDKNECPYGCPDSKPLYKVDAPDKILGDVDESEPEEETPNH